MARIRQVKPEFWTSEVVAEWPVDVRLTFIGLWTYVDDNGVGIANERLIASTLYPLDDPREALARVSGSLARLSRDGQVVLYEAVGKHLVFVRSWDEHQTVAHPRKPRFPRPDDGPYEPYAMPVPSTNRTTHTSSRAPHEDVANGARETHAGSRGQGVKGEGSRELGVKGVVARGREAPAVVAADLVGDALPPKISRPTREGLASHCEDAIGRGVNPTTIDTALRVWVSRSDAYVALLPLLIDDAVKAENGAVPGRTLSVVTGRPRPSASVRAVTEADAVAERYRQAENADSTHPPLESGT